MPLEKIQLSDTHSFSSFFLDYIGGSEKLKNFYARKPDIDSFREQIENKKSFPAATRSILTQSLRRQYRNSDLSGPVASNLDALDSTNTFTITTGHQLNIFTGPLYFIFKIVTVINTCKALKKKYPGFNFVPVYWMASEDHDFDEISYFRLNGKKYQWNTSQTGAVGRFDPTELDPLLKEITGDISVFNDAYRNHKTLSDAVRYYVNALFGDEGVVVVDADDQALKKILAPVMREDVFDHTPHRFVDADTKSLQQLGYHTQVNAREINFFYLSDNIRDRIEADENGFHVVNRDIHFSRTALEQMIASTPEKLSPNVILRPLYQEMILPNLAYVGGPSELVYWLQLKSMFTHFKIPFPVLMPRNFGMIIDHVTLRKFEKTGLELKDLFEEKNYLNNHWVLKNSNSNLTLGPTINSFRAAFEAIRQQAGNIDPTLISHVEARGKQTIHGLEIIEKKMLRAEKRRHAEKLKQIEAIKDTLFPGGNLQERTDNFLNFYQSNTEFLKDLQAAFDPFDFRMHILTYHD